MPHPPIIIPEIGKGEEKKIKNTTEACNKIAEEIALLQPDTIVIVTPHGTMFSDAIAISYEKSISGSLSNFGAPQIHMDLEIDTLLTEKIIESAKTYNIPVVALNERLLKSYNVEYTLDHGVLVPLYFLRKKLSKFKLVHITYSMLSDIELYKFGIAINNALKESSTNSVFIASGDLSHKLKEEGPYNYSPYGEKFDKEIIGFLRDGDILGVFNIDENTVENAGECGLRSYYIMLGAMNGYKIKGELLSYEGTFGVGYGVMRFDLEKSTEDTLTQLIDAKKERYKNRLKNEDSYVRLARESLTYYITNGNYIDIPDYVPDEMKRSSRGVFVSLKKFGNLRGCIGTVFPVTNSLAEEIIRNAVEAGEQDPRFDPVEESELEDIHFSVDVLTEPIPATREELDPKKYGVIVNTGRKSGLLLPDLEGVDTIEEQLNIVLSKAGINAREKYSIEKFEVIRHK
ncbi:AmmeMemoRadiSam system protein A [Clostridium polyendosporum]|nr:AmmeMemoRadiSam system protein A [Clostridium polyendosporum]